MDIFVVVDKKELINFQVIRIPIRIQEFLKGFYSASALLAMQAAVIATADLSVRLPAFVRESAPSPFFICSKSFLRVASVFVTYECQAVMR